MKMNKKTVMILAALGVIHAKEGWTQDYLGATSSADGKPTMNAESLQIHPETLRVLKMFSDLGALGFDEEEGIVYVDPSKLPVFVIAALEHSSEVLFDEERGLYILDDHFVEVLATTHSFSRLARPDAAFINAKILERLKRDTSPVLRDDLRTYAKSSFMAGF